MGKVTVPLLLFNGGEIDARGLARVDMSDLYPACAAQMENCWPSVLGPLSKMPGTEHFGTTPAHAAAVLRPFIYDADDAVLLELSASKLRFYDPDDGVITLAGAAATIGNFTDSSDVGASVTTGSTSTTLTATATAAAKARSTITTAAPSTAVSLSFTTTRRPLKVRIGSSAGGEQILADLELAPGVHVLTFTPGVSPYYVQVTLDEAGSAAFNSLTRLAAGALELATPWSAADLPLLRYEQRRDAMWWYLGDEAPRVLERRGEASWSLRLFQPEDGPFDPVNLTDVTLTPSATSGTATLTANDDVFASTDVGRLVRLTHQGQYVSDSFNGVDQTTDAIRVTGITTERVFYITITGTWVGTITLQRSIGNDLTFENYGTSYTANVSNQNIDDDLDNQTIYYRLATTAWTSGTATVTITYSRGSSIGYARIYLFTSTTSVGVDVLDAFGKTTATAEWALGAWCDGEGWPVAGTLFGGRHWLVRQDRLFGSVSDDYESFLVGTLASDAVDRIIGVGDEVSDARWIEGASRLLVGTAGAAVEVRASSFDEPITPDNMDPRSTANRGKGSAMAQAVRIDKRVVYIGKNNRRLYQLVYDLNDNSYSADDLTRLHEVAAGEELGDGFVELAVQYEPEPRVWAVREDGQVAVLLYNPAEGIYAWARYVEASGDAVESVCVLPGAVEDAVFLLTARAINGATQRHVEKLATERWRDISQAWRLRDALATTAPASNVLSGLSHLAGRSVYAWADGRVQGPFTVTGGGQITLAEKDGGYGYVIVGLNYDALWQSAKLSYGARMGTALCQLKKIERVGFITNKCVHDSFKYGSDLDALNTWPDPDETTLDETTLDDPLTPLSRDDSISFNSGMATDPRLYIKMDTPASVEILGVVISIDTAERP